MSGLMPRPVWQTWLDGYQAGYVAGIDRGRHLADDEAAAVHHRAVQVVRAMERLDPHEEREQRRREHQLDAAARTAARARPWPPEKAS